MCELARASVNHGQSIKIATFSTQDLQEQCHVASYRANEESVGDLANVFSQTMSIKVIRKSFLP